MRKITIFFSVIIIGGSILSCSSGKKLYSSSSEKKPLTEKALEDNSRLFIDAIKEKSLGNYDQAINLFEKALEINPVDDATFFELSKLYLHKNNFESSLIYAEKASIINPDNIYYQILYARLLQMDDQYGKAIDVYKGIISKYPAKLEFYDQLAEAYLLEGKPAKAIDVFDDLEKIIGVTEEYAYEKKKLYLEIDKSDKAIEEIEKLSNTYPYNASYYATLADLYIKNDDDAKALEALDKIVELDPSNPFIHISLAEFYKKRGENERAFEELKLGFYNTNLDIDDKIQILLAYYTINEIYGELKEEALELADIMVEVHPDDPKSFSMLGDFLYQDKQLEEAEIAFRKVISLDSTKYPVWEQLLFIDSELRNNDMLIADGEKTIEFFPEQTLPYLFVGGAYYEKKLWDKCVSYLDNGLYYLVDNGPLKAQFLTYLGDAYYQLKNYDKSDQAYTSVLEIDPDNSYVLNNYAYYLSVRGEKLEEAAVMAKRATELDLDNTANQDTYGWVLFKLANYEEAEKWIKKAIDNGEGSNMVILEHYGDVLWHLDLKDEAIEYWIRAANSGKASKILQKKVDSKTYIEEKNVQ